MPIFQPEHVRLVEQALLKGPAEGMTGRQAWEATGRAVPEHTVHAILSELRGIRGSWSASRSPAGFVVEGSACFGRCRRICRESRRLRLASEVRHPETSA